MLPRLDNSPFLALLLDNNEPVKRPPVKRNLFGTPSPEKQESDFLVQESRLADEDAKQRFRNRWGFDTSTGKPVENHNFQWIKVEGKDYTPSFYLKTYAPKSSKSRPVHSPRRERSHTTPYPSRPSKRGYPRTSDDENNDFLSERSGHRPFSDKKAPITADRESMFNTPKVLRLDSPSSSRSEDLDLDLDLDSSSSNGDRCSACSNSTLGFKPDCRSRPVSNKSSSTGLTRSSVSTGSSKQLTIKDLFQVKKSCSFNSFQQK